jgi:hypothetical protein
MAIGQETEGRGIGGFMQRSQRQWEQQRIADAQEEMRKRREAEIEAAEKAKARKSRNNSEDSAPASERGLNVPTSSIPSIGSNALTIPGAPTTGAGAGGATPTSFGTNSMVMYKALTDLGVKPEVAAGAVGSMMGESGRHLDPTAYNPNDRGKPSGGALQWRDDRLRGLYSFAGTTDINKIPIETQAKWMQRELLSNENRALQSLLKGSTVADGARSWTFDFERPADKPGETARRTPMGEQFWRTMQSGSIPATTTGSRNRDAGNARAPVQVAQADNGIRNDASPVASATTTPATGATPATGGSPTTLVSPPTMPQPAAVPASTAPLPPRRPETITPATTGPQTHANMGPPMPVQQQPAPAARKAEEDPVGGFFKDIGSVFSGEPIRDQYGREWDALYGFEKPPANESSSAAPSKSVLSDMPDVGAAFTPALNFFSSLFS